MPKTPATSVTPKYWEWYQARIARLFRKIPGATVKEDVLVKTKSGRRTRQIDTLITVPVSVDLGGEIKITIELQVVVDAKAHKRPVNIEYVESINGLRDDVGAHLAIIASPVGFTKGAKGRIEDLPVKLLTATDDLLSMLMEFDISGWHSCRICSHGGSISWRSTKRRPGSVILGGCDMCGGVHAMCGECGAVFGVEDFEIESPLLCPEGCGCVFQIFVDTVRMKMSDSVEVWDRLDISLMKAAYENRSKQISNGRVQRLIEQTKWQHWTAGESPTIRLTEKEIMEWSASGDHLCLTEYGVECYEQVVLGAECPCAY